MATYSFMNITASMVGPTGSVDLGYGASVAEEGITIEYEGDKSTVTMGADGEGQHNLRAAKNGTVVVRLLKTSPTNKILNSFYNAQTSNPLLHGNNIFTVRDPNRGDLITARQGAFSKHPAIVYARDGAMMEWRWNVIKIDPVLGDGNPATGIAQTVTGT